MKTILLSLILAVLCALAYFPVGVMFGMATSGTEAQPVHLFMVRAMLLGIFQPLVVVPGVIVWKLISAVFFPANRRRLNF